MDENARVWKSLVEQLGVAITPPVLSLRQQDTTLEVGDCATVLSWVSLAVTSLNVKDSENRRVDENVSDYFGANWAVCFS